ncbi:MAG: TonB-dependent receptor, partial [Pseudomonadota bacterium]|nr:TonB-dependent receptor [Pseudomonadota bacterium]
MKLNRCLSLAVASVLATPAALAQHSNLEEVVVTASPLRVGATDLVQAAIVLAGDDLSRSVASVSPRLL